MLTLVSITVGGSNSVSHSRTLILLQLLDDNRRSSASSVANACQSVLARLQVVHHVTHDSGPGHPDGGGGGREETVLPLVLLSGSEQCGCNSVIIS